MADGSLLWRYLLWREKRWPDADAAAHRRKLLAGLSGTVIEVGCGEGANFGYYSALVVSVIAVDPDAETRATAKKAAAAAPVRITVVAGTAEALPAANSSFDAAVCSWILCTVPEPTAALTEIYRVLRPNGELRFYEHVAARGGPLRLLQRLVDATYWPGMLGGCRTGRDTEAAIRDAGFIVDEIERFNHRSSVLTLPASPTILGAARVIPKAATVTGAERAPAE